MRLLTDELVPVDQELSGWVTEVGITLMPVATDIESPAPRLSSACPDRRRSGRGAAARRRRQSLPKTRQASRQESMRD